MDTEPAEAAPASDSEVEATPSRNPVTARSVLRLAFEAISAQPLTYVLLGGLGVLPGVLVANANQTLGRTQVGFQATLLFGVGGAAWLAAHLAISHGVVSHLRATPRSAPEMLTAAVVRMPTAAVAFLLATVAIGLGWVLLIVPGLFVAMCLLPLGAVVVIEGRGPLDSLRETARLTRGHRWPLFLAWTATSLLSLTMCCGLGGCVTVLRVVTDPSGSNASIQVFYLVANISITVLSHVISAAVPAAAHHLLRETPRPRGPTTF